MKDDQDLEAFAESRNALVTARMDQDLAALVDKVWEAHDDDGEWVGMEFLKRLSGAYSGRAGKELQPDYWIREISQAPPAVQEFARKLFGLGFGMLLQSVGNMAVSAGDFPGGGE